MEANEKETPSDAQAPCNANHEKAPFVKRHLPRRLLPKGCKPKKLFKKRASSLGKSKPVKPKCILRKCAEDTVVSFLWSEIRKLSSEACYGCEVDHPSQRQHNWCLMATDGERIDKFLEGVFLTMDHDKVFQNFEKELSNLHEGLAIPTFCAKLLYEDVCERLWENYDYLEKLMLN